MTVCQVCGTAFAPRNPKKPPKTCSRSCTNRMVWATSGPRDCGPKPAPRPVKHCAYCGQEFVSNAHFGRASAAMFCSRTCTGRAKTKGGVYFRKTDGRWIVNLRDGKKQLYARCVMEAHLRRHLESHEVVHHVNCDKTDDRIENLELLTRWEHPSRHGAEMREGIRRARILKSQGRIS